MPAHPRAVCLLHRPVFLQLHMPLLPSSHCGACVDLRSCTRMGIGS